MDDKLQLIAELIDKVSPNAKRMEQAFKGIQVAGSKELPAAIKKYENAVRFQERALYTFGKRSEGVRREMEAFKETVARTSPKVFELTKAVGVFSTGSVAMVGAITAVGAALIEAGKFAAEFAASMKEIKFGSAESGLGQLQLRQITQALGEFNISSETTLNSFKGLRQAMTSAQTEIGRFRDSVASVYGEEALVVIKPILDLITAGKTTAEVYKEIAKTLDKVKADHPGAEGEDLSSRIVKIFGMSDEFGRVGLKELEEKLEVIKKLGSTADEMKDAAEQAHLLDLKLEEGRVVLDKWLTLVGTDITKVFLAINDILDRADSWFNDKFGAGKLEKFFGNLMRMRSGGLPRFAEGGVVTKPTVGLVGEAGPETVVPYFLGRSRHYDKPTVTTLGAHGPEQVIPDRARAFIRAIGRTETDFSRSEAYSDALNKASNNAGVRKYGQAGADYGYYQMNQRDVAEAIKLGVSPEVAGHLAGGSQSTFAPAKDMSTLEQQTEAVSELLKRKYPRGYQALVGGGSLEDATSGMGGQWFGLQRRAKAQKEFDSALSDRANMNAAMGGGVSSTGQLDVNVRAPQGTSVKAEGGGIFQKTNLRRNIQMPTAPGGPPQ